MDQVTNLSYIYLPNILEQIPFVLKYGQDFQWKKVINLGSASEVTLALLASDDAKICSKTVLL